MDRSKYAKHYKKNKMPVDVMDLPQSTKKASTKVEQPMKNSKSSTGIKSKRGFSSITDMAKKIQA